MNRIVVKTNRYTPTSKRNKLVHIFDPHHISGEISRLLKAAVIPTCQCKSTLKENGPDCFSYVIKSKDVR